MTPTKPYLIRAFYEWIVENDCTPHVVVNAELPGVDVPREYVEGGQIVLNVAMVAVQGLELGNDGIQFKARFSGVSRFVYIPMHAVMAIYARENGRGMVFSEEDDDQPPPDDTKKDDTDKGDRTDKGSGKKKGGSGRPHLTVVK